MPRRTRSGASISTRPRRGERLAGLRRSRWRAACAPPWTGTRRTSKRSTGADDRSLRVGDERIPVVILCGGLGTRLAEHTEVRPKPLVEIGGRPILWHIMKHYSQYGFD